MISRTAIPTRSYAHVRLTVTDIDRSRAFYDDVFGLPVAVELPADADEETRERPSLLFGGVIHALGDSRADLDDAAAMLDERGTAHGGVTHIGAGDILEFRDPDGIALELFARAS
jgi:catechol 2,3-dioxygenase-like lactoylglutathione lyase family enzyme